MLERGTHADTLFDPSFYGRFYGDLADVDETALEAHWVEFGQTEGRYPNLAAFIEARAQLNCELPADFSVIVYKFLNKDLCGSYTHDWEFIVHYLDSGAAEGRPYRIESAEFVNELYLAEKQPGESGATQSVYTSIQDVLEKNGVISDSFLEQFSVLDYKTLAVTAGVKSRAQCIRHFCEVGLQNLIPINIDAYLDPEFYRAFYLLSHDLSAPEIYRSWINYGIGMGHSPNPREYLKKLGFHDIVEFPAAFKNELYTRWNTDLADQFPTKWHALAHFIEFGVLENRKGCELTAASADIYQIAADKISTSAQPERALHIYERVLLVNPQHTLALRHYADCLLRIGRTYAASQVYERTIELGKQSVWTGLNLATCYEKLEKWDAAINTLLALLQQTPGDLALLRRLRDVQRVAFEAGAGEAAWLAEGKFYEAALDKMRLAESFLTMDLAEKHPQIANFRRRSGQLTIAIVADIGLPQCEFYRVDQKIEHIQKAGFTSLKFDYSKDLEKFKNAIFTVDIVIFYRVPGTAEVIDAIRRARQAGIPTVYEIDDLMFDPAYFPESFASYGGQISNEMYAGLVIGTQSLSAAMSLCDFALASTPTLAELMGPLVRRQQAFVHRNAFGHLHEAARRRAERRAARTEDVIYIFYGSGTKAHNSDFDEGCAPALARLLEEFGSRLQLVILGYMALPQVLLPYKDRITLLAPIWDLTSYWNLLAAMDINLSVLRPSLMADCKSEIKWLEAAMFHVPTAMMATATHRDVAGDGAAAALVHRKEDWHPVLRHLIKDDAARQMIARTAYEQAMEQYSSAKMAENIAEIATCIVGAELNRKRRVLIVNVFFPPQAIGGATRVVSDNVRYFHEYCQEELEIEVFATLEGGLTPYEIGRHIWEATPVTTVTTPLDPDIDRKISDQKMATIFAQVLERFQPDLVHLHCIQRITVAICAVMNERCIPYVVTVHDGWWISDKQFLIDEIGEYEVYDYKEPLRVLTSRGVESFERMQSLQFALNSARAIISVSKQFAAIYEGCGFSNLITIENGVTPFAVAPRRRRESAGFLRLGYFGGLSYHKGYHLIRAALFSSKFDNLELVVIDHSMSPGSERVTKWGATRVQFRAKAPQDTVANLYAELDVIIAPSIWPESYGLVCREATRAGCWVIASDRGAIGSDVSAGSGNIVAVQDFFELQGLLGDINGNIERYRNVNCGGSEVRTSSKQALELRDLYISLTEKPAVLTTSYHLTA